MHTVKKKRWAGLIRFLLAVLISSGFFTLLTTTAAYAAGHELIISGQGLNNPEPITITQEQLRGIETLPPDLQTIYGKEYLEQHDEWYSTINTWPTKSWYRGKGVRLNDLLSAVGGLNDRAAQIRFTSADGFQATFSLQEILGDNRYRFPHFMDNGLAGHLVGDASEAEPVDTIIAYSICSCQTVGEIVNDGWLSDGDANLLMFGQQAVTQQTNARFVKYLKNIEVFTDPAPQWDEPTASVVPGEVPAGTRVELKSKYNDEDKVHYTLDGSDPTIESPMYNWIASRWWSSRADELEEINSPIEITDNMTIKAFVSGPGRADSNIAVFTYYIPLTINNENPADASLNQEYEGHTFTASGGVEPYIFAITEGTLPEGIVLNGSTLEGTPAQSGSFPFTLTVTDSAEPLHTDSYDYTLYVNEAAAPPALTTDISGNTVGNSIELTFNNDELWSQAITDVMVKGTSIAGQYSPGAGVITIDSAVFTAAGEYAIRVIAAGYLDAVVTQRITGSGGTSNPPGGDIVLQIYGDGVMTPREYTQSQLQDMRQLQEVYSCINTWPSKRWYVGEGIKLSDLLNSAGMKGNAQQIKFYSNDGYYMTFTVQELLEDERYRFPNFKSGNGDADGHIPGSSSGAVPVDTILALVSAEGTDDPAYMNDSDSLLLMLGQRAVTEQTGPQFVKYVNEIEVLTSYPRKWDKPTAVPEGGSVAAGTTVELHSTFDDEDKVYYTLDGSVPDMDSQMYNVVAKRWWSSRGEATVKEINKPILLTTDTTIKAITIGPGKLNSEVAEFTYKVMGTVNNTSGQIRPNEGGKVSLGEDVIIDIPVGALTGSGLLEVKIERVSEPPTAPLGYRIQGSVYEFSIGGETSYSFKKPVTIKLRFNAKELGPDETPVVHYYDQQEKQWIGIDGEVSGDCVSIQVDHFAMLAVMVKEAAEVAKNDAVEVDLTDISGHWAEAKIKKLIALGAIGGYLDATFKPDNNITRAEFTSILVKAFDLESQNKKEFADTLGHWAEEPICIAADHGIVMGHGDNHFGPDEYITREQMALMIVQVAKLTPVLEATPFTDDHKISAWARGAVAIAVKNGIINGYPDNTVRPQGNATRAEAVTVIVSALDIPGTETGIDQQG